MSEQWAVQQDDVERRFALVEASFVGLAQTTQHGVPDNAAAGAAAAVLALAGAALERGLEDAHQTALSLASFLQSIHGHVVDNHDQQQLRLLLDNLRVELQTQEKPISASLDLVASIAPTAQPSNSRVVLYLESRAIAAMLQETLTRAGFLPRLLTSMQSLVAMSEYEQPAAIIADLSLCQRDADTLAVMEGLRARISPPPHLFTLAGADDVSARLQAVRLGATRFLKKPLDVERLIAILKGVMQRTPTEPFRCLFVDDDRTMTTLYTAAMQEVGVAVRTTNDPLKAPALVNEFDPDVIVTDVYMPGCNGLELAAVLRQDELLADTPILFLSSETNIQRQMSALDLGGDDFLTKPVNLEVLQAAVIARAKRARMLKRSRREYRRVAEHLRRIELAIDKHSIVSIGDIEGNILYANQRFCDVSGYSANELLGANHRIVKSNRHPPEFYGEIWKTISRGRTWHGEVCNQRKDGSEYWLDATITPQLDDKGFPVRYVSVRTDITQLKEMQTQLMIAKAEAEAASQAKSVFLAHMSHELKSPLNSILGFSQLMRHDTLTPATEEQAEMLDAIERAGRHLLDLINDLVDLARIETGHLGLEMQTLALPPLIRECFALLKPQAQKRGISLIFEAGEEVVQIVADRMRVKQVLLNLLSNAVKYNCEKGTVTVEVSHRGNYCHVLIRDTGAGISLQDQSGLFQPFSRLRATAQKVEGTGIGLVLSKNLLERMGGQIGVISQPGEGSQFWFDLPAAAWQETGVSP